MYTSERRRTRREIRPAAPVAPGSGSPSDDAAASPDNRPCSGRGFQSCERPHAFRTTLVKPDRVRVPIQADGEHIPRRGSTTSSAVAGSAVKPKIIKLIAEEYSEMSSQRPMHSGARINILKRAGR